MSIRSGGGSGGGGGVEVSPAYDGKLLSKMKLDSKKDTELVHAIAKNVLKKVEGAVRSGADVNVVSSGSPACAPLLLALGLGHLEIADWLLRERASAEGEDDQGRSALHLLLQCNAAPPGWVGRLAKAGAPLNHSDHRGRVPLHDAITTGQMEAALELCAAGADPNAPTRDEKRPLHMAAQANMHRLVAALVKQYGCDINAANATGNTPLHIAAVEGHSAVLSALLGLGADVTILNRVSLTAAELASQAGHAELAALIRKPKTHSSPSTTTPLLPLPSEGGPPPPPSGRSGGEGGPLTGSGSDLPLPPRLPERSGSSTSSADLQGQSPRSSSSSGAAMPTRASWMDPPVSLPERDSPPLSAASTKRKSVPPPPPPAQFSGRAVPPPPPPQFAGNGAVAAPPLPGRVDSSELPPPPPREMALPPREVALPPREVALPPREVALPPREAALPPPPPREAALPPPPPREAALPPPIPPMVDMPPPLPPMMGDMPPPPPIPPMMGDMPPPPPPGHSLPPDDLPPLPLRESPALPRR